MANFNWTNISISYDEVCHSKHANVFKGAMSTTGHETVALKELRDSSYFSEDGVASLQTRLTEYVSQAQSLDPPNVCKVSGMNDGHGLVPLLVLPYFQHRDVVSYLIKHPDQDKIMLAVHILRALAYLHANDVIHGCIHSGNILVDDNGNAIVSDVKLDSIMFSDDKYCPIHSKCWWMPHERLIVNGVDVDELGPASIPADIYAVALTIAQLWTLRRPFSRIRNKFKFVMMLGTLGTDELVNLALPEEVPPYVSAVLRGCLSNDPHARPTAETLLASFEALL